MHMYLEGRHRFYFNLNVRITPKTFQVSTMGLIISPADILQYAPMTWIANCIIGLICCTINGRLFLKECNVIKSRKGMYTTKYLQWLCIISLSFGLSFAIFLTTALLPGFCHFSWQLAGATFYSQGIFLGFYQLSRLYYCFARNQVHSDKGYSNRLFISFGIIGILLLLCAWISVWFHFPIIWTCGISVDDLRYHQKEYSFAISKSAIDIWFTSVVMIYFIWDFITLLLYVCQIRRFQRYKTQNVVIYNRISSIMYRILICTLFYQIPGSLISISNVIGHRFISYDTFDTDHIMYCIEFASVSILWSYSLCLMLEHNSAQYDIFIRFLQRICCCFYDILGKDQMEEVVDVVEENGNENGDIDEDMKSVDDTQDIQIKTMHSDNELSAVTVSHI